MGGEVTPAMLNAALLLYSGRGLRPIPWQSEERVAEAAGADIAVDLIPALHVVLGDFYRQVEFVAKGGHYELDMSKFAATHPEVWPQALAALEWCYAYDNK